jgi:hypothetical protein
MEQRDEPEDGRPERPPGHFMDEQLEADTLRFLEQVRRLAAHRAESPEHDDNRD